MDTLLEKFAKLGCDNAPGQEGRQKAAALELRGEKLSGTPVDFSHGDVDAHPPIPGTLADFVAGVEKIGGPSGLHRVPGRQGHPGGPGPQDLRLYRGGHRSGGEHHPHPRHPGAPCSWPSGPTWSPGTRWPSWSPTTSPTGSWWSSSTASWFPSRWTTTAPRTRAGPVWT